MDPNARRPAPTVSNLVPVWEEPAVADDGGGRFEPAAAGPAVERVIEHAVRVEQVAPIAEPRPVRRVSPPERFDPAEPVVRRAAYELLDADASTWAESVGTPGAMPEVDYDALRRRDIARELLRARLVSLAEQRERRSAYEIAFIMLAAAVSVLLAAPPLVQVLLAAHGQA